MEMAQIPVRHCYIDFRLQVLGFKLDQFKRGEEITAQNLTDLEVSQYLYKICKVYGNDIEFQDSTRNLIDDMFHKNKHFFTCQAVYFVLGYMLPLCMQIFVLTDMFKIKACQIICLFTACVFFIMSLLQLSVQKSEYLKKFFNLNDVLLFIVYGAYFGLKYYDQRNYLPEFIMME